MVEIASSHYSGSGGPESAITHGNEGLLDCWKVGRFSNKQNSQSDQCNFAWSKITKTLWIRDNSYAFAWKCSNYIFI